MSGVIMIADVDWSIDPVLIVCMTLVVVSVALNVIGWAFFRRPDVPFSLSGNWITPHWRKLGKYLLNAGVFLVIVARICAILAFVIGFVAVAIRESQSKSVLSVHERRMGATGAV